MGAEARSASSRRAERKAENRAKLLAAARKVFAEKGLGEATARDIVRRTDLASGTFYNYFRDKEDAFRTLLDEASADLRTVVRELRLAPGRSLAERVESAYRAYFSWVIEQRDLFLVVRRNASVISLLPGQGMLAGGIEELAQDMLAWEQAGELPHLDREFLAAAAVAYGFQISNLMLDREPADVERATRFCTRLFLGGVRELTTA